jgi:hypothetical protein
MGKGIRKTLPIAKAPNANLILIGKGNELEGTWIEADLSDNEYRQSKGAIPPHLTICCPRCGGNLAVSYPNKTIRVDYLEREQTGYLANGRPYRWSKLVSVNEPLVCSHAGWGKAACGLVFRITNNLIYKG